MIRRRWSLKAVHRLLAMSISIDDEIGDHLSTSKSSKRANISAARFDRAAQLKHQVKKVSGGPEPALARLRLRD